MPHAEVLKKWQGVTRYGDLKEEVGRSVAELLTKLQSNINEVNLSDLQNKLYSSEQAMSDQANKVLRKVQTAVGLRQ